MGVDEEDSTDYSSWCWWLPPKSHEWRIRGPNAKNNAKLKLLEARKEFSSHQFLVTLSCKLINDPWERRKRLTYIVLVTPTPEYLEHILELEAAAVKREPVDLTQYSYHDKEIGKRHKRRPVPGFHLGEPVFEIAAEDDEGDVCNPTFKPRCRKQRGWGEAYRPTRHRRNGRNDLKCWKTKRTTKWHTQEVPANS